MNDFDRTFNEIMSTGHGCTKEMNDWYNKRTSNHIALVRKYIDKLDMMPSDRADRKRNHDLSKFKAPEYDPYVWITWKYRCADTGQNFEDFNPPTNIDEMMNTATHHHITTNSHHPEYHSPDQTNLLNRGDRDKPPSKMVDATLMPDGDIKEMCADWAAMSEERGNTPQDWAKKNVNIRWKFTKEQEELIYNTLDSIWDN